MISVMDRCDVFPLDLTVYLSPAGHWRKRWHGLKFVYSCLGFVCTVDSQTLNISAYLFQVITPL